MVLDIQKLSRKLLLKPFITFNKTYVTRLFNSAEVKDAVLKYLEEHKFIIEIDNLFLSTTPLKKTIKSELGYIKMFPISRLAYETSNFETKLREKIGITFDEYMKAVLNHSNLSNIHFNFNNTFNNDHQNWVFNRSWFDKIKSGSVSEYLRDSIFCPESLMNQIPVVVNSVSNDSGMLTCSFLKSSNVDS